MPPPSGEAIELGLNTADPTILVIDLNCAFASIEQQHDPALRGRPLAVAAYATDAATIVSSSKEARDLGVTLLPGCPVFAWERSASRITAAVTHEGRRVAGQFLVCAGAWSDELLGPLGLRTVNNQIAVQY